MALPHVLIHAWARSAVVPHGGAFGQLTAHEIGAPVLQALLARGGVHPEAVDALVIGNALGAGGNPARMLTLAAGLPERCPAYTVDTQCCAGLDAVTLAVGLIASSQADVVVAGGVEAWSRAPIRQHRPRHAGEAAVAYDRPAFAPDPERDPDMLVSAARYALAWGYTREAQDAYALDSHARALAGQTKLAAEIVPVLGVTNDLYPRTMTAARAARMPSAVRADALGSDGMNRPPNHPNHPDCSVSALGISAKADGAAFVLLSSAQACTRLGLRPRAAWMAGVSAGIAPETPLLAAEVAARAVLRRMNLASAREFTTVELHDAFAVQGLSFRQALSLSPQQMNQHGGGLARGHPIGASGTVALVRLLADLSQEGHPGDLGMTAVAGAGGLGAAAVVCLA